VSRARFSLLLLLAFPLAACGKEAPAPEPEPSVKVAAPEVKATPSATATAEIVASAAPTPSATAAPTATSAASAASAAVDRSATKSGVNAPIALPKSPNGVLAAGAADKILASGAPALVRLLDPGAEPRADLSYAIAKGPAPKLGMDMDMAVSVKAGGHVNEAKLPKMGMTLDGSTNETNAAGEWKILASLVGITIDGKGAQAEQMAAAMRPQIESMKGLGINYWLNPKGRVRDVKIELPKGFPPAAEALVQGLNQSFESMVAPLPIEAVGLGAKWQVVSRMAASGADLLQSATYTLKARDGARATLDVVTTQVSASDTIKALGAPGGALTRVKSYSSGGTGTTKIDTTSVVPEGGTTTMKTGMTVVVSQGGEPGEESAIETRTSVTLSRP
jgi:hypothetical protein